MLRVGVNDPISFAGDLLAGFSPITVETAIEVLKAEPEIEYAEPNYIVEFDSACPTPCIPNDPEYRVVCGELSVSCNKFD